MKNRERITKLGYLLFEIGSTVCKIEDDRKKEMTEEEDNVHLLGLVLTGIGDIILQNLEPEE